MALLGPFGPVIDQYNIQLVQKKQILDVVSNMLELNPNSGTLCFCLQICRRCQIMLDPILKAVLLSAET